jgi:DNA-binding GntR family transcriptional regulator
VQRIRAALNYKAQAQRSHIPGINPFPTVTLSFPSADQSVQNGVDSARTLPMPNADNRSLVDQVYDQVLARIVRGELPGGSELKSTVLAEQLGVSRTPVVQALSRLIADGIVTQRMNMRATVRPGAENWLVEIHELRLLLEPPAASRAAELMPADVLQQLQAAADQLPPRTDDAWVERARQFDFQLHLTIADYCGNQPLRGAIYKCWQYKGLSYVLGPDPTESIVRGLNEHLSILAALQARDARTAAAAMELHLRHASSYRPQKRIV